jgi:hypothetical protein
MHGEAVLVNMMDGDMVWALADIMVDMGKLKIIVYHNRMRNI